MHARRRTILTTAALALTAGVPPTLSSWHPGAGTTAGRTAAATTTKREIGAGGSPGCDRAREG